MLSTAQSAGVRRLRGEDLGTASRELGRFLPQCHGGDVHDAFLAAGEATRDRLFRRALVDSDEAAKSVVMRVNAEAAAGYTDAYYQAAITATRSSPGRGS